MIANVASHVPAKAKNNGEAVTKMTPRSEVAALPSSGLERGATLFILIH
jgi:hypothetical protein